tara:strand:- start:218 stop:790 length:573 start_codon:yes stop_codon:yes gene_type:complete
MKRPIRSPIEVPDLLEKHIKGKVVCEIGCMEGDLLMGFAKHAKKVYGLEVNANHYDKLREVENRFDNIEILYRGVTVDGQNNNWGTALPISSQKTCAEDIPEADLYYFWIVPPVDEYLINKIQKGKIACMKLASDNKGWFKSVFNKHEGIQEYIEFVPKEEEKFGRGRLNWGQLEYNEKTPLTLGILNKI